MRFFLMDLGNPPSAKAFPRCFLGLFTGVAYCFVRAKSTNGALGDPSPSTRPEFYCRTHTERYAMDGLARVNQYAAAMKAMWMLTVAVRTASTLLLLP